MNEPVNQSEKIDPLHQFNVPESGSDTNAEYRRALTKRYLAGIGFIVLCSFGSFLTMVNAEPGIRLFEYLVIGLMFGLSYGVTVSLSLWSALGQGSHFLRILLAISAAAGLICSMFGGVLVSQFYFVDRQFVALIVGSMILQAILILACLGTFRALFGLRLTDQQHRLHDSVYLQFKIVHILGLTLAVAITLAIGKAALANLRFELTSNQDFLIFIFLLVMVVLMTLPLGLACLVGRRQGLVFLVAIVGTIMIGAMAFPALYGLGFFRRGPDQFHLLAINLGSIFVVLIFTLGLRFFGYRLNFAKR
jgi:hypothetical protein